MYGLKHSSTCHHVNLWSLIGTKKDPREDVTTSQCSMIDLHPMSLTGGGTHGRPLK